jgi:hypothetical protein
VGQRALGRDSRHPDGECGWTTAFSDLARNAAREGHSCLWGGVLVRGMRNPATPRMHEGCVGPVWVLSEVTRGQEGLRDVLHGQETAGVRLDQGPVTPEVTSPW